MHYLIHSTSPCSQVLFSAVQCCVIDSREGGWLHACGQDVSYSVHTLCLGFYFSHFEVVGTSVGAEGD